MSDPTILVVEDERDLANLYAEWVGDDYEVLVAYDGESALELASEAVDVVLLDRHMPGISGDEVVTTLRRRDHDCWVIMVTAVDPGFDIIDLEIDDYLTKPITRAQLMRVIQNLRVQSQYHTERRELQALSNKMETLEREVSIESLVETEEYRQLERELKQLGDALVDDVRR